MKEILPGAKTVAGNRTIELSKKVMDKLKTHRETVQKQKEAFGTGFIKI
jgi:hypothetical protein